MAISGNRIGDISYAVQRHAESFGFEVVRELVGHGLGREMHEKPEMPNYGKRGSGKSYTAGVMMEAYGLIHSQHRSLKILV